MSSLDTDALTRFIQLQYCDDSLETVLMDHLRMSAIYWSLSGLFLLHADPWKVSPMSPSEVTDFIASCHNSDGGFGGNVGLPSHALFTLSALQILWLINDRSIPEQLSQGVDEYIWSLQQADGSFVGDIYGEVDSRFSYCAVMSLYLLKGACIKEDPRLEQAIQFVESCRNWDGGFGAMPGAESHAGNIFCCQAALSLMGRAYEIQDQGLREWLSWRQTASGGLNGRPQKLEDVCYSWWVLSALQNLNALECIDRDALRRFILRSQEAGIGAIADRPGDMGDLFHSFFGVAGLSLLGMDMGGRRRIDPILCLPR